MLQVRNRTPFVAKLLVLPDSDGVDNIVTVIKATFDIGGRFGVADEQHPDTLRRLSRQAGD
jgi:hypothetical protein